jgi:hypothetical protein
VPLVMTMMHFLKFKGGYGLHFLVSFFFSFSWQTNYFVVIFCNIKDLDEGFCLQTKCLL